MKPTRYFLDSGELLTEVDRDKFEKDRHIPGRRITIEGGMVYEWVRAAQGILPAEKLNQALLLDADQLSSAVNGLFPQRLR